MTPAVVSVLTNGLTCGVTTACEGGTIMTAGLFTLWCGTTPVIVEPPPPPDPGGGSHPTPNNVGAYAGQTNAGRVTVSYPPSEPNLVYIDPNKVMGRRVPVKLTFKMGETEVEKIYTVSVSKAESLIKVMNFVTTYKKKISVNLANFYRRGPNIKVLYKRGRSFISKRHDFD